MVLESDCNATISTTFQQTGANSVESCSGQSLHVDSVRANYELVGAGAFFGWIIGYDLGNQRGRSEKERLSWF